MVQFAFRYEYRGYRLIIHLFNSAQFNTTTLKFQAFELQIKPRLALKGKVNSITGIQSEGLLFPDDVRFPFLALCYLAD